MDISKRLFQKIIRIVAIGCEVEARHNRNFDVLFRTIEDTVRGWKGGWQEKRTIYSACSPFVL